MNISDEHNGGTAEHDEDEIALHGLIWHLVSGVTAGELSLCLTMREPGDDLECLYFECEYSPETANEYVYFLEHDGLVKIGRTNKVKRRFQQLNSVLPRKTTMIHYIKTNNSRLVERALHGLYARSRKKGEWFELTPTELWSQMFYREVVFYEN